MKYAGKIPSVGARIIKSSAAVVLCMLLYYIRTLLPIGNGIPFYSALAALWCMQPDPGTTRNMALQRTVGTFIGAVYGFVFLVLLMTFGMPPHIIVYLAASVMIIPIIYTTVLINKRNASFFSCVVFLSIALTHSFDDEPFMFVLNRVLDTLIGIAVGVGVNTFRLPEKHDNETLYISGIDSVLVSDDPHSVSYNRVELNRLISEGVKFTISTIHTPAELIAIMKGVDLKIPVIVMDGAAIFDIPENRYIYAEYLDDDIVKKVENIFSENDVHCFASVLYDHTLIVYYGDLTNPAEKQYFEKCRRSPYSNYIDNAFRHDENTDKTLYLMGIDKNDKILKLKDDIEAACKDNVRITVEECEIEGFACIKIYSPLASKNEMIKKLLKLTNSENKVTFGSIRDRYDVYIGDGGGNDTVKKLKRLYTHSGYSG